MAIHSPTENTDYVTHAATYHHFMLGVKWVAIHLASVLVFLIVAFATGSGILPGLIAGAIVFAIGVFAMTHGLAHSTEGDGPAPPA